MQGCRTVASEKEALILDCQTTNVYYPGKYMFDNAFDSGKNLEHILA